MQSGHSLASLHTQLNTMFQLLRGKAWNSQSLCCLRLNRHSYLFFQEENAVLVQRAITINCQVSETVYLVKLLKQEIVYVKLEKKAFCNWHTSDLNLITECTILCSIFPVGALINCGRMMQFIRNQNDKAC